MDHTDVAQPLFLLKNYRQQEYQQEQPVSLMIIQIKKESTFMEHQLLEGEKV